MKADGVKFIVELEQGVWIAVWDGDPGRTLVRESAKKFGTFAKAQSAITKARKFRPFALAKVIPVKA